jgi:hypothetical protein
MRRTAVATFSVILCMATAPAVVGAPPAHAAVVIAVIEDGLNPYHDDFARPDLTASPATYLPGYPKAAKPLRLSLDERDYAAAVQRDDKTWRSLKPGQLYYVPGTSFVGLVHLPGHQFDRSIGVDEGGLTSGRPVVDGYSYHGTGVASAIAGRRHGGCPKCLVVLVAADDQEVGLAWAAKQSWIDVVSNSWGGPLGAPSRATAGAPARDASLGSEVSRAAAASGKVVLFASGNGVASLGATTRAPQHNLTYYSPYAGPPWVLTVGAARKDGQPTSWHNVPVDVIARGEQWPVAAPDSTTGEVLFMGTSCSTPVAAGVIGEALRRTRAAVGDHGVGSRRRTLVVPGAGRRPRSGPLADGRLTRAEVVATVRAWAAWQPFDAAGAVADPFVTPTTPAAFAYEGYGLVDASRTVRIADTFLGRVAAPARPEMTEWAARHEAVRVARWGAAPS